MKPMLLLHTPSPLERVPARLAGRARMLLVAAALLPVAAAGAAQSPAPAAAKPATHATHATAAPRAASRPAANDFPTSERVIYVQDCVRDHPGPHFEMLSKCSCALDHVASEVPHAEWVTLSTISKAMSIGGERGGAIRDAPSLAPQVKRLREIQARALQACFLVPDAR